VREVGLSFEGRDAKGFRVHGAIAVAPDFTERVPCSKCALRVAQVISPRGALVYYYLTVTLGRTNKGELLKRATAMF